MLMRHIHEAYLQDLCKRISSKDLIWRLLDNLLESGNIGKETYAILRELYTDFNIDEIEAMVIDDDGRIDGLKVISRLIARG